MRHTPETGTEERKTGAKERENERKRFELSVPQVAGSAIAAVLAAKLASTLGVYGTILGAGVISVIATCGGPVLQHVFKRTGEQMRGAGTQAKPHGPRLPATPEAGHSEEFGAPTTHGTRVRGWKRPFLGAAVVFLVAMGGITAYELSSGQDLGGTQGSTTFGSAVRGRASGDTGGDKGEEHPSRGGTPDVTPGTGGYGSTGGRGTHPTPDTTPGTGSPTPDVTPTPTPTPSGSAEPTDGGTTPPPTEPPTTPPATAPASPRGTAGE
ncbi:hypothetical protein [Streptomyces sp. NPDC058084]|uniref:hypothetical protein n=1 Tax=Streptomyces sp. NPDC058084 TaxID=3346333 RepID=UPI0036E335C6